MSKLKVFDVFTRMVERDDQALKMAPLSNIIEAKAVKAGTKVTIGVEGNMLGAILAGKLIGGLFLCDKARYDEVKAELEREASTSQAK